MTRRTLIVAALLLPGPAAAARADQPAAAAAGDADLIVHNAKVVTVDPAFRIAEAVAVRGGRVLAVGTNAQVLRTKGDKTRVIDAAGRTVLPGLYDCHVHAAGAATSELRDPVPVLRSVADVLTHVREKAKTTPEGQWIVIRFAFPTRLAEGRFPTRQELDSAAPNHPVLYHAGPAGLVNTQGLKVSGVTRDTPSPKGGVVVKDPVTGEPTGMLRSAYGLLKGLPGDPSGANAAQRREAVKKMLALYNSRGLTSIAERDASPGELALYRDLRDRGELTLRVNVARSFSPSGSREEIVRRLEALPGKDGQGGPTGVGDDWVRIGPLKIYLDGGMLNGTAYMRQPWPKGETYQITEDGYRGLRFLDPEQLRLVAEEAARRRWQLTAHTAGEAAMDTLLDAYEVVNRVTPIKDLRMCITHANFPSRHNLERCRELGVVADVQPVWLYKDGTTLRKVLGPERMRWFHPYKSWLEHTTIGGGSDHMIKLDPLTATNPWDPWLGLQMLLTRTTERGTDMGRDEALTREQAVRVYTIHSAYVCHEEKLKGSLEPGKLGDLVMTDRDVLTCPADQVAGTRVLATVVGGKVVYEAAR